MSAETADALALELLGRALVDREVQLRTVGHSMAPLICDGELVKVRSVSRTPRRSTILLASTSSGPVCHRLLRSDERSVTLCGDQCATPERIAHHAIVGEVVAVIRGDRYVPLHRFDWRWRSGALRRLAWLRRILAKVPVTRSVLHLLLRLARPLSCLIAGRPI